MNEQQVKLKLFQIYVQEKERHENCCEKGRECLPALRAESSVVALERVWVEVMGWELDELYARLVREQLPDVSGCEGLLPGQDDLWHVEAVTEGDWEVRYVNLTFLEALGKLNLNFRMVLASDYTERFLEQKNQG